MLSTEQQAIMDYFVSSWGNMVIDSTAGSGKTFMIRQLVDAAVRHFPSKEMAYLVFNKANQEEASKKMPSIAVNTFHSVGMKMLGGSTTKKLNAWEGNTFKYLRMRMLGVPALVDPVSKKVIRPEIPKLYEPINPDKINYSAKVVEKMYDYARAYNVLSGESVNWFNDSEAVRRVTNKVVNVCEMHGVLNEEAVNTVVKVLENRRLEAFSAKGDDRLEIDFNDMLFFATLQEAQTAKKYDIVFVDEGQDMSQVRYELAQKILKPGGRMIVVGDPYQSIYGFTGAFPYIFLGLAKKEGWTRFTMSTTYRCAQNIVKLAQSVNPDIKAKDGAEEGTVSEVSEISIEDNFSEHAVLCRTNAPLFHMYFKLHKQGIPVNLVGEDIKAHMLGIVRQYMTFARAQKKGFSNLAFGEYLAALAEGCKADMANGDNSTADVIESLLAMIGMVDEKLSIRRAKAFHNGKKKDRFEEAWEGALAEVFGVRKNSVKLMSIHKSKGGEWENVWFIRPDLLPHSMAEKPWEVEQEINLKFVLFTRAKKNFYFVKTQSK